MGDQVWTVLISEHGPWVFLVVFLLWRDMQKDKATREVLDKNTQILAEMTTILRERLPRAGEG